MKSAELVRERTIERRVEEVLSFLYKLKDRRKFASTVAT